MRDFGPHEDWAALCELCEWSAILPTEGESKIVAVLHAIQNHPLHYAHTTGKDPEKAAFEYKDLFAKYRGEL